MQYKIFTLIIFTSLMNDPSKTYQINPQNFVSCPPNVTTTNGKIVHWNATLIGDLATPWELCLDNNGMPITRKCKRYVLTEAYWLEPSGNCSDESEIPDQTSKLHQLIKTENIIEVLSNITAVTDEFEEFIPMDVHLLSEGLKAISAAINVSAFEDDFLKEVSNAMRVNSSVLREAQERLNSTDKILDSIENFINNIAEDIKDLSTTIQSNILTQITCPFISDVIGLALYKKGDENFDQYELRNIKFNQTFEDLPLEDLELAIYVPTDFIMTIIDNLTAQEKEAFKIVNTVFYNDGLFNDVSNENRSAGSRVINVNIPSIDRNIETPISILFRPILNFSDPNCVYWDYGKKKIGKWSTSGGKILEQYGNETLLQCTFNHTNHFALLVLRENIIKTKNKMRINPFLSCPPNVTTTNGKILHWNVTLLGDLATPWELCLDNNGMPITRRCETKSLSWSEPSGNCSDEFEIPVKTSKLHQLIKTANIIEVLSNITAVTDEFEEFIPVDVNLLSEGLKAISAATNVSAFEEAVLKGVSNAMKVNSTVLKESQKQLNSTDKILDSIGNFVLNVAEDIMNVSTTIQSNILTQITCPFISDVIGLALYKKGDENFDQYEILNIKFDQTFEDLPLENLELAIYVPTNFIRTITNNLTAQEKEVFKIVNTVFYNDGLFNDVSNENHTAGSRVINVAIPSHDRNIETPINILFRPILNFTDPNCVYWDYGQEKFGKWSTSGGELLGQYGNETLLQCTFDHITHFALLVLRENIIKTKNMMPINPLESHKSALSLITLIGCGLSSIGILIILYSALIFKNWHKKRLHSIQLAIVLLMEIIVLFVADLDILGEGHACAIIGGLLHYIILSKFTWILIIARRQYLRFVKVLKNLGVKSRVKIYMITGWILPIIPVVLAMLIFRDNYTSGQMNFCYAKDYTLYFFLILPASIIILINIGVFFSIMVAISRSKAGNFGVDLQKIQIRTGVMLFFMLGITWIFGILTQFLDFGWPMLILIYLFCILAPLQGFVLFVFIVLLDKTTVALWEDMFKMVFKSSRSYDVLQASKESDTHERSTRNEVSYASQGENVTFTYFLKKD